MHRNLLIPVLYVCDGGAFKTDEISQLALRQTSSFAAGLVFS